MIKQLRTIHLGLLLLVLILLAASLAEQRGPLQRAYEDSVLIRKWSGRDSEIRNLLLAQAEKLFPATDAPDGKGLHKFSDTPPYLRLRFNGATVEYLDRRDRLLWGAAYEAPGERGEVNFYPLPTAGASFEWDTLDSFIGAWNARYFAMENPLSTHIEFDQPRAVATSCGPAMLEPSAAGDKNVFGDPINYNPATREFWIDAEFDSPGPPPGGSCELKTGIVAPVELGRLDLRRALSQLPDLNGKALDATVAPAPFAEAFPDLSDATKYLTSLGLGDLENHLRAEANKEGEKVEIFGAKLPYDLVSVFGATLLVASQFYLWCHLVELTTLLSQKRRVYDFTGYIGLYTEIAAVRIFTLLSVSAVPAGALAVTIWKNRHNEWWEWITPILALPLSLFLGALLVRRFRQVWALKPKGEPPPGITKGRHGRIRLVNRRSRKFD